MSTFKVIEIIDSHRIKVSPRWSVKFVDGRGITGDIVIINSLLNVPTNEYLKQRLTTLLLDKEVELYSTNLVGQPDIERDGVKCTLYLNKTEISFYFPEYIPATS